MSAPIHQIDAFADAEVAPDALPIGHEFTITKDGKPVGRGVVSSVENGEVHFIGTFDEGQQPSVRVGIPLFGIREPSVSIPAHECPLRPGQEIFGA
jgi:hypothetical protein